MDEEKKSGVGIRITSDPDVTSVERPSHEGALRQVNHPLRLLLVSDLTPGRPATASFGVDASRFAPLLDQLAPRLEIEVVNRLARAPRLLDVQLNFRTISDFEPNGIVRQVPALKALQEGEKSARGTPPAETRAEGQPVAPKEAPQRVSGDALDRLLGLVDTGDGKEPASQEKGSPTPSADSLAEALIGALTESTTARASPAGPSSSSSDEDPLLSEQLDAIYNHPAFRDLEAAWRGLRFLVRRLDFRRNVRLHVLPAGKSELAASLDQFVLQPERERDESDPPLSAIIVDFDFDASAGDIASLQILAEAGAQLQVPVIASAAPAFFEVATAAGLEQLPPLRQHLSGPAHIAWHKLRDRQEARFLVLAVPTFILREPYGDANPSRGVDFTESSILWGRGALLLAALTAASFVEEGAATRLSGGNVTLDGLPLRHGPRGAAPLGAVLTDERMADLASAGFAVLGCRINRDSVYLAHPRTVGFQGTA